MEKVGFFIGPPLTSTATSSGVVTIGFRAELLAFSYAEAFNMPLREASERFLGNLSPLGQDLVKALGHIPGVSQVSVHRNDMSLFYSSGYRWAGDVGPQVQAEIHRVFTSHGMQATRRYRRKRKSSA